MSDGMKQIIKLALFKILLSQLIIGQCLMASTSFRCEDFILTSLEVFQGRYVADLCPDNIFYLVKTIWSNLNQDQKNSARVLYVYSKWNGKTKYHWSATAFNPKITREGASKHWTFHVVLYLEGYIYDFEHNNRNIRVKVKDYFRDMFGAEFASNFNDQKYSEKTTQYFLEGDDDPAPDYGSKQRMHVRSIPAADYLNEYSFSRGKEIGLEIKNYIYWLTADERYPDISLENYLFQLNSLRP
jgi:hypothetical protein